LFHGGLLVDTHPTTRRSGLRYRANRYTGGAIIEANLQGDLMPRVSEIENAGGDPILSELFAKERAAYGDLLNPTKVMAHCPPILRAAKALGASIAESGKLPKGLASLICLRVAAINGCPF
jgi:alkylhydroperoxidase family enzyme